MESVAVSDLKSTLISTELLRQKIRDYTLKERTNARAIATDALRFGLGEIKAHIEELSLTEKDVHGLAGRIKRRKHATIEDMYRLSHAFLLSKENINAFSNTPGALQVLVKELTGSNSDRQISAIECLCNLSLGELHVCEKICNLCGSYLVTYLESSEKRLKQTSLWTLSNLIATGAKCAETLLRMELLRKLCSIYVCIENADYCEDAGNCLQLLCLKTKHLLNENHYKFIIEKIMLKTPTSVGSEYQLQIIFNCDVLNLSTQMPLEEQFVVWLIHLALNDLHCSNDESNRLKFVYAIRIIANLLASYCFNLNLLRKLLADHWQSSLSGFIEFLLNFVPKELISEVLWLLRNILEAARQLGEDLNKIDSDLALISLPSSVINMVKE